MTKYRSESQISDAICQKSDVFKLRSADERGSTNGRVGARDSVREILATLPTTYIWSPKVIDGGYALPPTDRVPFHAHTTHSATGASLSPVHVFGTVFRHTCAMRTLRTAVSGVNSKRFVLMLLPGCNETFVNCAI